MTYINFSTRLPKEALEALDAEAARQFRSRNQLLQIIVYERFNLAPSSAPARARATTVKRKPKPKPALN
jgi:hypothetical protein